MRMMVLAIAISPEKEKLVVQLYSESKSYREISKMARISVRDIKPILQKYGADILKWTGWSDSWMMNS